MAESFTLLKESKNVCCYHCCELFLLCTNIILAPLQETLNLGKSLQNSNNRASAKFHVCLSKTNKKFVEPYFDFLL